MESALNDVLEQAFKLVAEVDRRAAQERERQLESEKQARLGVFQAELEKAFDFSSREKIELGTRRDLHEGEPVMEFMVRNAGAVFVLRKAGADEPRLWRLDIQESAAPLRELGRFEGGKVELQPYEDGSRRIAAVRVVAAIGTWLLGPGESQLLPVAGLPVAGLRPSAPPVAEAEKPVREPAANRSAAPVETEAGPEAAAPKNSNYGTFGKFFGY